MKKYFRHERGKKFFIPHHSKVSPTFWILAVVSLSRYNTTNKRSQLCHICDLSVFKKVCSFRLLKFWDKVFSCGFTFARNCLLQFGGAFSSMKSFHLHAWLFRKTFLLHGLYTNSLQNRHVLLWHCLCLRDKDFTVQLKSFQNIASSPKTWVVLLLLKNTINERYRKNV